MENKLISTIKNILIAILFFSAIVMSYLSFDTLQKRYSDILSDELASFSQGDFSGSDRHSDVFILPEIVAVKDSGKHMNAISSGAEYMNDIYRLITKDITFAEKNCVMETSDHNLLWNNAIEADNFIYVRYHSALPSSIILIDAAKSDERSTLFFDKNLPAQIYELLIFPSNTNKDEMFAISRGTNGECTKYIINENADISELSFPSDFDIYVEASAMTLSDFYGIKNEDQILIPTTVLFINGLNSRKISVKEGIDDIKTNTELKNKLALILNINPSKTGSYYDSESDMTVYMPTHGELSIGTHEIKYSTARNENGGVPLSDILGSDPDAESYSLYKYLVAVRRLAEKIKNTNRSLLGDEAEPILTALYRENDMLTFEYSYFFANTALADMPLAFKVSVSKNKLMYLEIHPISVTFMVNDRIRCLPQSIITSFIEKGDIQREPLSSTLVYRYRKGEKLCTAEWEISTSK